jgi:hypothetical protein
MPERGPRPLPHAYTNVATMSGDVVTKTYRGPDATQRQQREALAIASLQGRLPVATILESRPGFLVLARVPGRHGQDLIDAGEGHVVMYGLGALLREVQAVQPDFYDGTSGDGILVHGDFGPNNVLFAEHDDHVALLADWEWSTKGSAITDLAWAEFIVRMHHPDRLDCIAALFDGYGHRPPWSERQAAMAQRAAALETWVRSWKGSGAGPTWARRSQAIKSWDELP